MNLMLKAGQILIFLGFFLPVHSMEHDTVKKIHKKRLIVNHDQCNKCNFRAFVIELYNHKKLCALCYHKPYAAKIAKIAREDRVDF